MKKLGVLVLVLIVAATGLTIAADQYRYDLYAAAINFETERAGLVKKQGTIGDASFAYLENTNAEDKEAIIMLHGFSADKSNWLRFAKHFSEDYRVIALDLMGHGETLVQPDGTYSIVGQVEFVASVAQLLDLKRFHLVGNSMGGAISSLYAATYPDQVITATLISPAGVHDIPSEMDALLETGQNPLVATSVEEFYQVLDFVMEAPPFIPGPIAKVQAEKAVAKAELNKRIFTDIRNDMTLGLEQRFAQIKAPVLIIWGDQDRAINAGNIDRYAQLIPKASKQIYQGIGHLAMIEVPERSANEMRSFIAGTQ